MPALDPGVIEQARTRARRRLVGAAILVVAAVIGFPLLFDSKPRSLPVDLGVEVVHGDGHVSVSTPVPAPLLRAPVAAGPIVPEGPAPVSPRAAAPAAPREAARPAAKPQPAVAASRAAAPKPVAAHASRTADDSARVQALLEGRDAAPSAPAPAAPAAHAQPAAASAPAAVRYVVQVGAFADVSSAHEARMKVEKLGIKTYTQVITGDAGKRIRVRVGPFAQRQQADQAVAKIKQTGLNAAVLTL